MKHEFDLVIVGGGILGAFHAYHALNRGLKVALFERSAQPSGASVRNFGQIVPSGLSSEWRMYGKRSLELYRRLKNDAGLALEERGSYYIASDDSEVLLLQELHLINQKEGYSVEWLDASELVRHQPAIHKSYPKAALFYPLEMSANPKKLVHQMIEHMVKDLGLHYHSATAITAIEEHNGAAIVHAASGKTYEAGHSLICSGNEVTTLYPEIFAESDLQFVKLQMLRLSGLPAHSFSGNVLTGLSIRRYECFSECPSWAKIKESEPANSYARANGIHILFKQEADGSVIVGDSHHYRKASGLCNDDYELNATLNEGMLKMAAEIAHLETSRLSEYWNGWYTQCSSGSIFKHDVSPKVRILTGIGGKGMTASAGYAEFHLNEWLEL